MNKLIAGALLLLIGVSLLALPWVVAAQTHADYCFDEWERCRERALASDAGWIKTTLMLTACDLALLKCIYLMA